MKLGVPWRVKGIRPDARETAREAARRAGMSVGEWLNTVILDSADEEGIRLARRGYADEEADEDQLFGVHERLDELTRQLERMNHPSAPRETPAYTRPTHGPAAYAPPSYAQPAYAPPPAPDRDHLAEAIARLDRRLDEMASSMRAAPAFMPAPAPRANTMADPWSGGIDQAMAEIAARQQALDADPDAPIAPRAPAPMPPAQPPQAAPAPLPAQNLSGLEQHLRHITSQIESLRQQPQLEEGITALRQALGEIARTLMDAMPRRAIEALEGEVRALAGRLDSSRHAGVDASTLATVEQGLAEIRDSLRTLTPAENLDGFREAVRNLAQKVDQLGASGPDANAYQQLEAAISALRGIVSHVASNEALAHLAGEVHALAAKIDQVASAAGGIPHSNALEVLEQRVAHIADALESRAQNGGSVPPQLEAVIAGLSDKIERLQHSRGDDVAFVNLEDRVAKLVEKLDASGARFSQLEAIERGLADLLAHIEGQRTAGAAQGAAPVDGLQRDLARTQTSLEAVHGTLGHVVDRLAMIESDMRGSRAQPQIPQAAQLEMPAPAAPSPVFAPAPAPVEMSPPPSRATAAAQAAAAMARANPKAVRVPIDPNLPPDHPLEPGMNAGRGRLTASPADRIAASEAALGRAKPPVIADPGGKSNFIAAARRAAKAAASDPSPADLRAAATQEEPAEGRDSKTLAQRVRSLFVGASVILIVGGGLRIASNLIDGNEAPPTTEVTATPNKTDAKLAVREARPAMPPALPLATPENSASSDITGSLLSPAPQARTQTPPPPPIVTLPALPGSRPAPRADKLPNAIGGTALRMAAAEGSGAAQYEVGVRYAEGQGVAANSAEAARWLELAARQGVPMAQFRLAGLYEKGIGVKKDIETARRLYKAAAEQGNAKAMHNLAVLYAEGAAVKPDYRTASQWFRMAADHGLADSQYNLAILYARGIGVDQNLAESYKWFTLAANQGDEDAAKKRDDVAKRLDPTSLATARLAAQTFIAQPQPETATSVKAPVGGWDASSTTTAVPAPAPKPKRTGPVRVGSR